jgi:FAD/FMN-containing dehydrogenase
MLEYRDICWEVSFPDLTVDVANVDSGGLSFHSTQYGWASTHVLEHEVILANGTIRKASKESHPDLHRALQSGGNTLGIVSSFTLRTFPQGAVRRVLLLNVNSTNESRFGAAGACIPPTRHPRCSRL